MRKRRRGRILDCEMKLNLVITLPFILPRQGLNKCSQSKMNESTLAGHAAASEFTPHLFEFSLLTVVNQFALEEQDVRVWVSLERVDIIPSRPLPSTSHLHLGPRMQLKRSRSISPPSHHHVQQNHGHGQAAQPASASGKNHLSEEEKRLQDKRSRDDYPRPE